MKCISCGQKHIQLKDGSYAPKEVKYEGWAYRFNWICSGCH